MGRINRRNSPLRWLILGISLFLLQPRLGEPQEAVVEVGLNLYQNTITALQSVAIVANQVIDLTPMGSIAVAAGYADDMAKLAVLADSAMGLSYDMASLQAQVTALFGLESAPRTSFEFAQRMREIRQVVWQSHAYAMRAQTLLMTVRRTITHAVALVDAVGGVIGTLQSGQTVGQATAKLVQLESEQKVTTTAFQRAQSVEAIEESLILQSIKNINDVVWSKEP